MKRILSVLFFSLIFANLSFAASFVEGTTVDGMGLIHPPLPKTANKNLIPEPELAEIRSELEAADKQLREAAADEQDRRQALKYIATYKIKLAMLKLQLKEYTIPEGISLGLIAQRFNVSVEKIMELNKGNPAIRSRDLILADYKIYLPAYPEDEVKKLENELIELVAGEYIFANQEIKQAQNEVNDMLTELAKVETELGKQTDDAKFFKAEAGWLFFLALLLLIALIAVLLLFINEKEKNKKLKTPKRESLIEFLEQRPAGEVLQVLNMAVLGNERNPKTLKKLRDYIEELTQNAGPGQYDALIFRPLKDLPGYNRK